MAATKLTLRLEEAVIRRGKVYAKARSTSLSKLVEQFLQELIAQESDNDYEYIVEPDVFVSSIGIKTPTLASPNDPSHDRRAYYEYLTNRVDE